VSRPLVGFRAQALSQARPGGRSEKGVVVRIRIEGWVEINQVHRLVADGRAEDSKTVATIEVVHSAPARVALRTFRGRGKPGRVRCPWLIGWPPYSALDSRLCGRTYRRATVGVGAGRSGAPAAAEPQRARPPAAGRSKGRHWAAWGPHWWTLAHCHGTTRPAEISTGREAPRMLIKTSSRSRVLNPAWIASKPASGPPAMTTLTPTRVRSLGTRVSNPASATLSAAKRSTKRPALSRSPPPRPNREIAAVDQNAVAGALNNSRSGLLPFPCGPCRPGARPKRKIARLGKRTFGNAGA
jgi:hypothetical protein